MSSENPKELVRNGVIPVRSAKAASNLVDLSKYYTASLDDDWLVSRGANLVPLPKGIQSFASTDFDVRGLIQLAGLNLLREASEGDYYPERVDGISVHLRGRRIQFLHATSWKADEGQEIGEYVVHYANGQTRHIPIRFMESLKDWWAHEGENDPTDAEIAWTDRNEAARRTGGTNMLFKYTWENPLPDVEINTIDYLSHMTTASPFLVAITIE
ncbi:MAG: hypothetical protein A2Y73_03320 [Chloroflexi bacterium RBG_13_56_8]|nr:MAG: hypothetical protein A2Y73_03320 [Chloroflexi bacterium RBG_13_56_8]